MMKKIITRVLITFSLTYFSACRSMNLDSFSMKTEKGENINSNQKVLEEEILEEKTRLIYLEQINLLIENLNKKICSGGYVYELAKKETKDSNEVSENENSLMNGIIASLSQVINNEVVISGIVQCWKFFECADMEKLKCRLAHLLGQMKHESGRFQSVVENLNYSKRDRFKLVFNERLDMVEKSLNNGYYSILDYLGNNGLKALGAKATMDKVLDYIYSLEKDERIEQTANLVYGMRKDLGNNQYGDGFKYRGRGFLQVSGKNNYLLCENWILEKLEQKIDLVNNPDLIATKFPFVTAVSFFDKNNLFPICDGGVNSEIITELTKKINGGVNGLEERKIFTEEIYTLLQKIN